MRLSHRPIEDAMRKAYIKKKKKGRRWCYPGTQTDEREREREREEPASSETRWMYSGCGENEYKARERNNKAQPRTRGNSSWK